MSTKAEETVEEVTQKLKEGDDELLRLIRQMVTRANGRVDQDLEQEVFLRVLEVFRDRTDIRHPRALMYKIVHDRVVDEWRARSRAQSCGPMGPEELPSSSTGDIEEGIDEGRRLGRLREAILELGCDIRGPVYLFYVESYSIRTLGRIFGKSPSAIKMALHRGRHRLDTILSDPDRLE